MTVLQAYGVVMFAFTYAIPVIVFAFCYGYIFHTIRRQSKVVAGHVGRSQDVPMATTSRDPNTGQVQQQATGTTTGAKLSHSTSSSSSLVECGIVVYRLCCFSHFDCV